MKTEQLWHTYGAALKNFVRAKIGNHYDADDVLQDIFMKVHQTAHTVKDEDKVRQWLFTVARNAVNDHFRKSSRRSLSLQDIPEPQALEPVVAQQLHNCVMPLIRGLSPEYRRALVASDLRMTAQAEAANALQVNYSTFKSRVQRARQLLKKKITDCCRVIHDRYGTIMELQPVRHCACGSS